MKIIISISLGVWSLFASEIINISSSQQRDLGIKMQVVSDVETIEFGPFNGLVVLDKKDVISMSPNIESIVKSIHVRDLEHVKKGQKLLAIKSNALLHFQQEYIVSLLESESAKLNYERNRKLHAEGIISNKKLLASRKLKKSTDLEVRITSRQLRTNGFTSSMLKKIQRESKPFLETIIYAPRDGVIHNVNVNIGEYIPSDRKMIEVYADGKRFIEITVPIEESENLKIGEVVTFSTYTANITAIGNVVQSMSQSVIVRALIQDANEIMINRIYEVKIERKVSQAYKIKKSTLVFNGKESFVFKKVTQGFEVQKVRIIKEGPTCYIVEANLNKGDNLAANSTSALLSAMDSEGE